MSERFWIIRYRRQDGRWPYMGERVFATEADARALADRLKAESALARLDHIELVTVEEVQRVTL